MIKLIDEVLSASLDIQSTAFRDLSFHCPVN